jgi:hypothetical protein
MPTLNGASGIVYQPDVMQLSRVVDSIQSVTSSTALTTVPQLTIPIGINERVLFRYNLFYTTATAADISYTVDVPTSPTLYRQVTEGMAPDDTAFDLALATAEGTIDLLGAANTDGFIRITGVLHNGSTAGEILFKFAQKTSTASATSIRAGSFLEYRYF